VVVRAQRGGVGRIVHPGGVEPAAELSFLTMREGGRDFRFTRSVLDKRQRLQD
jgi:hypothetical protein